MIGYVYLTVNDVNDIIYVGKRQKPKFEKYYKGSGTHLKLAFKKYGKDKFHTSILEECNTKEQLNEAEIKWIAYFRKQGKEMYNITDGGDCGYPNWWTLEPKKVAEIIRKNREAHMGEKNPFYGRKHSEETKAILREKNKDRVAPKELLAYKEMQRNMLPKVVQLNKETGDVIRVWDNWCDASKAVSKSNRYGYAHIGECCRHKRKSAYGYRWEFAESEMRL